jgi:hypothetical protein
MLSPRSEPHGDYIVYSARKFFGLPDGGAVVAKRDCPIPRVSPGTDGFFGLRLLAFCMRNLYRVDELGDRETYLDAFRKAEEYLDASASAAPMSEFSLQLLQRQDLDHARNRRRENFAWLREHWPRQNNAVPLRLSWQASDVPLGFPVWARDRDAFRKALIQERIFPPVHWQLPEAVRADERFRAAKNLSEHIITIPCDQRYGIEEMKRIVSTVSQILTC